ncbi:MAG: hypothetical protein ABI488_04030 [Polyangiaceae bacterium]
MKTFFWDFFGPRSEGTAQHFLVHLREFLKKNDCPELPTGLSSEGAGHHAVSCSPTPEFETRLAASLRPRRIADDAAPSSAGPRSVPNS